MTCHRTLVTSFLLPLALHWFAFTTRAADPQAKLDIVIRNARVIDGTGMAEFRADVGIRSGRIVEVGKSFKAEAREIIDGTPYILCPGFVDLHNHGDRGILMFRNAENYVRQGATTLVCGNCGSSPTDMTSFMRELRDGGAGINIVMLIGHGSVRQAVIGDLAEAPTVEQLVRMRAMVRQAMEAGAVGMSSGLRYRPGAYAKTDEVIALAKELAAYGGFYATHMRDEGTEIVAAFDEALTIGKQAGVPVHISHHKISAASVWGLTKETLAGIDRARASGMDVTLDQYPYGAGSSGISLLVPQPAVAGGAAAFRRRISDPAYRQKIIQAVEQRLIVKLYETGQNPENIKDTEVALARVQLARSPGDKELEGKNLTEILKGRKTSVTLRAGAELVVELVGQGAVAIYHTIDDRASRDVERVMRHPQTCFASDGGVFPFGQQHPHPRSYGTYPRILGRYVRDKMILGWEEAIHKMTELPARRLGWTDRGLIKPGYWADVVLLKPDDVRDLATFQTPHRYSVGIEHVIIRGEFVLKSGKMTEQRTGRPVLSVPVATTPETKLRRELIELLSRHDGRFALYAEKQGGKTSLAINADDLFPIRKTTETPTLRAWTQLLARTDKNALVLQSKPGDAKRYYLRFQRSKLADGQVWHIGIAYDKVRPEELNAIIDVVENQIPQRFSARAGKLP